MFIDWKCGTQISPLPLQLNQHAQDLLQMLEKLQKADRINYKIVLTIVGHNKFVYIFFQYKLNNISGKSYQVWIFTKFTQQIW